MIATFYVDVFITFNSLGGISVQCFKKNTMYELKFQIG